MIKKMVCFLCVEKIDVFMYLYDIAVYKNLFDNNAFMSFLSFSDSVCIYYDVTVLLIKKIYIMGKDKLEMFFLAEHPSVVSWIM